MQQHFLMPGFAWPRVGQAGAARRRRAGASPFCVLAVRYREARRLASVLALLCLLLSPRAVAEEVKSWLTLRSEGVVLQQLELSCGAAAIAMVLQRLYGQNITEAEVLEVMQTNGLAATMTEMVTAIDNLGYRGRAVALSFEALSKLKTPLILFIRPTLSKLDIGHFVVLERVTEDGVIYRDPTFGNRVLDIESFRGYWETREDAGLPGRAIAILPREESQRARAATFRPLDIVPVVPLRPAF